MAPRTGSNVGGTPEFQQSVKRRIKLYCERYFSGKDIWTGKALESGFEYNEEMETAPACNQMGEDDVLDDE